MTNDWVRIKVLIPTLFNFNGRWNKLLTVLMRGDRVPMEDEMAKTKKAKDPVADQTAPAAPAVGAVVKPWLYSQLAALIESKQVEGPYSGYKVELSKGYKSLINGTTGRDGKVIPGHPEDAALFLRSASSGEILVYRLKAEGKYATVRKCAETGQNIVVRMGDLARKRTVASCTPKKALVLESN